MDTLAQYIAGVMVEKLEVPAVDVGPQIEFESMNLDSLVLVQLAVLLGRRYGISLDDAEIIEAGTIENTAALLVAKGAKV